MKGYRVLDEISIPELLTMREEYGMSNPEIAASLDISSQSVWRLTGPGPRSKNSKKKGGRARAY